MRGVAILAIVLGLVGGLTACGGGDEAEPSTTTATTAPAVGLATIVPDTTATVSEPTETPIATVDSKYDEEWAREQVEPVLKEVYEIMLAQEWNKLYDLYSSSARAGCSRTTYVSKIAGLWLMSSAFGGEEILKASLQDLEEGNLTLTFSEITKDRITYQVVGDDEEPTTIVREDGKWKSTQPLEADCASLDTDSGATATATASAKTLSGPIPDHAAAADGTTLGNADAAVTIYEYSEFQCPFCARAAAEIVPRLDTDYLAAGKAKLIFKTMAFIGEESRWAAEAALCARDQGKFWEYHNKLFEEQEGENKGAFEILNLKRFATEIGLDQAEFNACFDAGTYTGEIADRMDEAENRGVNSTPTFFVGQTLVDTNYDAIAKAIDAALQGGQGSGG